MTDPVTPPRGFLKPIMKLLAMRRLRPDRVHTVRFVTKPFDEKLSCQKGLNPLSPEARALGLHDVFIYLTWMPTLKMYHLAASCGQSLYNDRQKHLWQFYEGLRDFIRAQHEVVLDKLLPLNR